MNSVRATSKVLYAPSKDLILIINPELKNKKKRINQNKKLFFKQKMFNLEQIYKSIVQQKAIGVKYKC